MYTIISFSWDFLKILWCKGFLYLFLENNFWDRQIVQSGMEPDDTNRMILEYFYWMFWSILNIIEKIFKSQKLP